MAGSAAVTAGAGHSFHTQSIICGVKLIVSEGAMQGVDSEAQRNELVVLLYAMS